MEKVVRNKDSEIKDKKRVAISGNSLGRENRATIRGQVVDIGIFDPIKAEDIWDFVTGMFAGDENEVTPFLDFSLAPVRKPILKIEILEPTGNKAFVSEDIYGDEDGFFTYTIRAKLKPENYIFHVIFKGSDSYRQYTRDLAFINRNEKTDITKITIVGKGELRILPEDYNGFITTSDIDQTYLATDIFSKKGKFSTLFETPEQKRALPGMPIFYQKLRQDTNQTPLCFISASPHFFKRTLLATIKKHGIISESLYLKYLEGTIKGVFDKLIHSFINLDDLFKEGMKPALTRVKKFFGSSYQSLFDQLSYKLSILLQNRLYHPTNTKEILLGDNTESDYFIFTLYQLILQGKLVGQELEDYLYRLNFLGRDAITRDSAVKIKKLASECTTLHGKVNPVYQVLINVTDKGPGQEKMMDSVRKALPQHIRLDDNNTAVFLSTQGAVGFSIILHALGVLQFQSVVDVTTDLIGQWFNGKVIDDRYLVNLVKNLSVPKYAEKEKELLKEIVEKALS
ncbi:MAG: hypothetical protein H7A23_26630 [Leptospiraceae bacterium]|nr:hypothetical protein [Leptospiraceae bacterium]MCP5498149.1 hypothetical protein [Leptospiraceae bacterium]